MCQEPDLNWWHEDFQSSALPAELSRPFPTCCLPHFTKWLGSMSIKNRTNLYHIYHKTCEEKRNSAPLPCERIKRMRKITNFVPLTKKENRINNSEVKGVFFGDRGTWTLTISKVDGFSYYSKFPCCRYWHVEGDSIFILVWLISYLSDFADYGVNALIKN